MRLYLSTRVCPLSALLPVLVLLLVSFLAGSAQAQNYTSVVVFGDSLSDTGNIAHLTQAEIGIRYPARNVLLGFNYTDGRFTDGLDTSPAASAYLGVWVEQLAASFPHQPAVKNSLDGGTNYAYGDATTNDGTTTVTETGLSITLNNMGQQVTDYLATNPTPNAQILYVLWGGSNDVYADSSAAAITAAVSREAALVQRLIAAGSTNFLIPNLPPLGGVPDHSSNPSLNAAALSFDMQLAASLNGVVTSAAAQGKVITILQPDIYTRFATASANPAAIGLANVSVAAQGISGNPDTYLIWDGLHPTTIGHHYVAATAAQLITPLVASTNALIITPGIVVPGGAVIMKATVQPAVSSPASPAVPATGLVTFFNNGTTAIGSATLATVNGIARATATYNGAALASSPYNITAVYAGDTTYNISTSAAQTLTVSAAVPIPTSTVVTSSALNGNLGSSITFTATIMGGSGSPSGSIAFLDGGTSLGSPVPVSNGAATYTTSTLTAGTHVITAIYSGDGNSAGSTSTSISEIITAPAFTASVSPTSITIPRGSVGTATVTLTTVGGYAGSATFACGALPAHLSCTFAPASITFTGANNSATSTLTIATNASAAVTPAQFPGSSNSSTIFAALLLPGFGVFGLAALRRRSGLVRCLNIRMLLALVALSMAGLLGISGCGGSSNAATGTYTVAITATGGSTTSTVNLTAVVQ